jgi:tetratricopeptide (TPR) repeat protein
MRRNLNFNKGDSYMLAEHIHLQRAAERAGQGDFAGAAEVLRAARREWPFLPSLAEHLAVCLRYLGDWAGCLAAAEDARRHGFVSAEGEIARAEALARTGERDAAEMAFLGVLGRGDPERRHWADVARTAGTLGFADLALDACRRILLDDPEDADALLGAAMYSERLSHPPERVERLYRRAVKFGPGNRTARAALGMFLFRRRRFAEAHALLSELPDSVPACGCVRRAKAMLAAYFEHSRPSASD